jgi:hypothetical protein
MRCGAISSTGTARASVSGDVRGRGAEIEADRRGVPAGLEAGILDDDAGRSAPLRGQVRQRTAVVLRERRQPRAADLDRGAEHVVRVEGTEDERYVLPGAALGKAPRKDDPHDLRDLPPEDPRGPDRGGVRPRHRDAERPFGAVHVRVRVGGGDDRSRGHVTPLDHDLVADPRSGRVELDSLLAGERLDGGVARAMILGAILHVVVERHDAAFGVEDARAAYRPKSRHDRRRVVVRHQPVGANPDDIAGRGRLVAVPAHRVSQDDRGNMGGRHRTAAVRQRANATSDTITAVSHTIEYSIARRAQAPPPVPEKPWRAIARNPAPMSAAATV